MSLADRDYMYERGNRKPVKGPWRSGKLLTQPARFNFLAKILVFGGIVAVLTWAFHHLDNAPFPSWQSAFPLKGPLVALPETGNVTLYQLGQQSPAVAEFKIIAVSSHVATHHLVKLIAITTGAPVLSVFVRNGEIATIKVPLGTYKINMAEGGRWYGETKLFGTDMQVKQGTAPLSFTATQNSITGHTLTLEGRTDGNYPTRPLAADHF